jgi:two-component system, OmpR family, sensor histidine kinase KdpD
MLSRYFFAILVMVCCTIVSRIFQPFFSLSSVTLVFVFGVVLVAAQWGRGPSILASLYSVAALDYFFCPPLYSFDISSSADLLTLAVMLVVAVSISTLTTRVKRQAEVAEDKERRTETLYQLTKQLSIAQGRTAIEDVSAAHLSRIFKCTVEIADANGDKVRHDYEIGNANTTGKLMDKPLILPMLGSTGKVGVCSFFGLPSKISVEQKQVLESCVTQISMALESLQLAEQAETERLRSTLLSSFSHDLRTPLATITGAATGLLETEPDKLSNDQKELARVIYEEAERLERFVANLLNMTRLEAGVIAVHKEYQPIEEVVGSALTRMESRLLGRAVNTELTPDLASVPIDAVLIEQVIINLIDNALKYTNPNDAIKVGSQKLNDDQIVVFVSDSGAGVPSGEENKIFDKFYRADPKRTSGFGLGLSICKAIVEAHGGRIWIENTQPGACFKFTLPTKDAQLKEGQSASDRATSYSH